MISRISSCACGSVLFDASGPPILSAVCYCDDCQEGGHQIEALAGAAPIRDPDHGTSYLIYRDDRFACVRGADLLRLYELSAQAPTARVVATCCNSGMFLKYKRGHWVSAYRARFSGDLPPVEIWTQTKHKPTGVDIPDDAPSYRGFPFKLFARLIEARFAMWLAR